MARLNKKELRLAILFASTLFFAGNVTALKRYITALSTARTQLATYSTQRQEIDILLSDREYWETRQHWLDEHQPLLDNPGAAQGELIETIQRVARDRGITILDQTIMEPSSQPHFQEVSAKLKLSARLEDMVSWLAEIQSPERFTIINQLTLSIDSKSKEMELPALCTLQVGRLYSPNPATPK